MPFKETLDGDRVEVLLLCCYRCENTQLYYDAKRFECVLWRYKYMNGLWLFIAKLELPKGYSQT